MDSFNIETVEEPKSLGELFNTAVVRQLFFWILLIWTGVPLLLLAITCFNYEVSGQVGDTFGAVNTLFSGMAFGVLFYTLWLQKQELRLQREELKLTRTELSRSADAQKGAEQALKNQIHLLTISTQMSAWLKAQELWTDKDFTAGRRDVLERPRRGAEGWYAAEMEAAKHVCRKLDEFAQLIPFLGEERCWQSGMIRSASAGKFSNLL